MSARIRVPTVQARWAFNGVFELIESRQTLPNRVLRQLGNAVQVELFHELAPVGLDGLDAHVQPVRDLLGREPLGHELQHLALAGVSRSNAEAGTGAAAPAAAASVPAAPLPLPLPLPLVRAGSRRT